MSDEEQGGTPEESAETPENNDTPSTPDPVGDAEAPPQDAGADVPADVASENPDLEPDAAAALAAAQAAVSDAMEGNLDGAEPGDVAGVQEHAEATADDIEAMMAQAMAEEGLGPEGQPAAQPTGFAMPSFSPASPEADSAEMQLLGDVNVDVRIELGRTRMLVEDVLRLGEGAVVELEKLAGDPVDVFVNGRHVAKGEVLVLNESFCVRVNEVLEPVTIEAAEDS